MNKKHKQILTKCLWLFHQDEEPPILVPHTFYSHYMPRSDRLQAKHTQRKYF